MPKPVTGEKGQAGEVHILRLYEWEVFPFILSGQEKEKDAK